jgi:hypothetical protein
MAGKSVAEKLQIKPGSSLWLGGEDQGERIAPLPAGVEIVEGPESAAVALIFAADSAVVLATLDGVAAEITKPPVVWIAYPKGNRADINRDSLWPIVANYGLRPNGQVAIDDVWSALRFRANREGEEPFDPGGA